jgi:signal peptidase II
VPVINRYSIFSFFLILLDQLSKFLAIKYLTKYVVYNSVGAYSIGIGKLNFSYISVLALLLFVFFIPFIKKDYQKDIGYYLILSGGISNIVDRFLVRGVVDFIPSKFFGSFNLADIFISIGAAIMILELLVGYIKEKSREN